METEKGSNDNLTEAQEQSVETLGYQEQVDQRRQDRVFGAKILSQANFETRHQPIVESSFKKYRQKGEKLPGKNNERRNYSYLSRIEKLVDKYGNSLEKRLWNKSADQLIISPEDITDDYWRTQEQILRDNGQGHTLNDYEKQTITEDIQKAQRESLKSWSDYLGSEESPYPMWFKVYAWDGMSKMGVFDKEKQQFAKRNKHTVAPYPKLNPAVLAKVYNTISDFYNQPNKSRYDENPERNIELEALVRSGNFNKLYSKILLSEKAIPKTPERTEDIHGEWVEYLPGEEEKLAAAAEGTPWCIADPGAGRSYLTHRSYNLLGWRRSKDNRAKFILFHLQNPETNTLSSSACASIRLDSNGRVAEISGLNDSQALEDSLVPVVEEKVCSLPGGEKFLEAFADKKQLIALDRKMQNDEDLNKEELEFLYEINRPIKSLDTYRDEDPRIIELKNKYGLEYALDAGIDANLVASRIHSNEIVKNLDTLIKHGANIDQLVSRIHPIDIIADNLDTLIKHGAKIDIDDLVSRMYPYHSSLIARNLDTLVEHGAKIDIDDLVSKLDSSDIARNLDTLVEHGAKIDIDNLVSKLFPSEIGLYLNTLISHGANIDDLVSKLDSSRSDLWFIAKNLDTLIEHGAKIDIDDLVSRMYPDHIAGNLDALIGHGAKININKLTSEIEPHIIADNLDALYSHGAKIDIDDLVSSLDQRILPYYTDDLRKYGANI